MARDIAVFLLVLLGVDILIISETSACKVGSNFYTDLLSSLLNQLPEVWHPPFALHNFRLYPEANRHCTRELASMVFVSDMIILALYTGLRPGKFITFGKAAIKNGKSQSFLRAFFGLGTILIVLFLTFDLFVERGKWPNRLGENRWFVLINVVNVSLLYFFIRSFIGTIIISNNSRRDRNAAAKGLDMCDYNKKF